MKNINGNIKYTPNATTPNQLLAADKSSGIRFNSETLAKPANPFSDNPCHDMTLRTKKGQLLAK